MGAQGAEDAGGQGRDAGAGAFPGRRIPRLGLLALLQLVHASGPVSGGHHLETAPGAAGALSWAGVADTFAQRWAPGLAGPADHSSSSASPFRRGAS